MTSTLFCFRCAAKIPSVSCVSRLPMVQTTLTLSPLYDENRVFIAAVVHFAVSSTEMFPSDVNRAQQMLQNFNTTLRDPLGMIFSGIISMTRRLEVDDTASCEQLLQQLNNSCYHMLKSCNSLSEYTGYSNGLTLLNLKSVFLNLFLEDLFRHLQMFARRAGIEMTYALPKQEIQMNLDPDKLVIVLTSLMSNSIAFYKTIPKSGTSTSRSLPAIILSASFFRTTVQDSFGGSTARL